MILSAYTDMSLNYPNNPDDHDVTLIRFEPIHEYVRIPTQSTAYAAGYDLYVDLRDRTIRMYNEQNQEVPSTCGCDTINIPPRWRALLPLGFRAQMDVNHYVQISIRSGVALKRGLIVPNSPGIIDPDYTEEWGLLVANISSVPVEVTHGERLGQAVLLPLYPQTWKQGPVEKLGDRDGGFGSTGTL